jgi:molecular chaperone GrpE
LLADGETRQSAVADFARELLAVADNLQRALAAIGEEARGGEGSLIECVEATRRLLTLAFERFRVRPIEALGKRQTA